MKQNTMKFNPVKNLPKFSVNLDTQQNIKPQTLNRLEQSMFMKDLLNIPKDLKELLAFLINSNSVNLHALLQTKINSEILKQLFEKNSKEVINKLIRLIQQSPDNTQNHEQLKQILNLIAQTIPAKNASPQEIFTHLLLLYLPWLPLFEQQKIEVRFEKKKSSSSDDESIAMIIYISTINLGRFKVNIIIDKSNNKEKPEIYIENIKEKEENESPEAIEADKEILKSILKAIKVELKEENITAKTSLSVVKQKKQEQEKLQNQQEDFKESDKREVSISNVTNISMVVLITAQKVAQVILDIDEKISLLEKRYHRCTVE